LGAADHPKFLSPPAGDAAAAFLQKFPWNMLLSFSDPQNRPAEFVTSICFQHFYSVI
jgi:hypothetical protein